MKYANYDKNFWLVGFYDDKIHDEIPAPNVKLSDEEWKAALNSGANFVQNGKLVYKQKEMSAVDLKQKELAELEEQIKEIESYIRHAILIGNDSVLPKLREEYKELLSEKEKLQKEVGDGKE